MDKNRALAVMVKAPVEGYVKTRLSPPLTPKEAAGLYRAFIADILSSIRSLDDTDLYLFYAPFESSSDPSTGEADLKELIPPGVPLLPQKGADLGERMKNVFDYLLRDHDKAAIIGSDSPDLPISYIKDSYRLLGDTDGGVVLGPAEDGGYYLIAMDSPSPVLFDNMEWSTDTVLDTTIKRCSEADLSVKLLPRWYDVDTIDDVRKVRERGSAKETCRYIKSALVGRL